MISFLLFYRHIGLVFTISETWEEKEAVNEVWKFSLFYGKKSDYLEPVICLHVVWRLSPEESDWKTMIFHYFMFSSQRYHLYQKKNTTSQLIIKRGWGVGGNFCRNPIYFGLLFQKVWTTPFPSPKKNIPNLGRFNNPINCCNIIPTFKFCVFHHIHEKFKGSRATWFLEKF